MVELRQNIEFELRFICVFFDIICHINFFYCHLFPVVFAISDPHI